MWSFSYVCTYTYMRIYSVCVVNLCFLQVRNSVHNFLSNVCWCLLGPRKECAQVDFVGWLSAAHIVYTAHLSSVNSSGSSPFPWNRVLFTSFYCPLLSLVPLTSIKINQFCSKYRNLCTYFNVLKSCFIAEDW